MYLSEDFSQAHVDKQTLFGIGGSEPLVMSKPNKFPDASQTTDKFTK